jgi:hypothetical protein
MKRGTPLARRTPLKRVRLRKVNPERKAALHTAQFGEDDAYAGWLRTQECACGCGRWEKDRMHLHHSVSRGAGGDYRTMVPLHWSCHERGHTGGWQTFERERGVDLREKADVLWGRWLAWMASRPLMGPRNP